jgi:hypothetical protein
VKQILTGGEQKSIEKDKYSVIHRGGTNIHWEEKKSLRINIQRGRINIYIGQVYICIKRKPIFLLWYKIEKKPSR